MRFYSQLFLKIVKVKDEKGVLELINKHYINVLE